jgi:hypothetical protein
MKSHFIVPKDNHELKEAHKRLTNFLAKGSLEFHDNKLWWHKLGAKQDREVLLCVDKHSKQWLFLPLDKLLG